MPPLITVNLLKGKLTSLMAFSHSFYPRRKKLLSHRPPVILIFDKNAKQFNGKGICIRVLWMSVLVASDLGDKYPAKPRALHHGAEHTHLTQESEKLKKEPGGKDSNCRPRCCFTPTS